jgi:tetratricopeptide (TPR) repeat protein
MVRFFPLLAVCILFYSLLETVLAQNKATESPTVTLHTSAQWNSFFSNFEAKDWVTLGASLSAFIFALISYRQKASEASQARRKQLTDVLQKLSDLNTEMAKFRAAKEGYPSNYIAFINDQRRFLLRQAAYISRSIGRLVSPYEYLLIATASDDLNYVEEAERYFKLATGAKYSIDRAIAVRGYARFLFRQGNPEEARKNFKQALDSFTGETDRHKFYRGETYERWATEEREWSN